MKIVPIFHVTDMHRSLEFYSKLLDFHMLEGESETSPVIDIANGDAQIQLSTFDGQPNTPINVWIDDLDGLFEALKNRDLDFPYTRDHLYTPAPPTKPGAPANSTSTTPTATPSGFVQ